MSESSPSNEQQPWVKLEEEHEDYAFGRLFKVVRASLRYRRFDGHMSEPVTRINFVRGMAAGVLLYDPDQDTVILVRQFRYPVYANLSEQERRATPQLAWVLELVAGVPEEGASVKELARKELIEEAGIDVTGDLEPIATIYPSPGGTSEQITIFLAHVDAKQERGSGGGVLAEGEDTQVVEMPFQEALAKIRAGEITDAKTIIALQHLALQQRANNS